MNAISPLLRITASVASVVCGSIAAASVAKVDVPVAVFKIDQATVGSTTLDEVRKIYGSAEPARVSREEEADVTICYVHRSPKGGVFVVFESGVMGGYKQITGFRLSTQGGSGHCVPTERDVGALATENGIALGQALDDFRKAIPVSFKRRGRVLAYEGVTRRPATADELKQLRAAWPNERQYYYDVTTTVRATFNANRLVDLYVRKIESY